MNEIHLIARLAQGLACGHHRVPPSRLGGFNSVWLGSEGEVAMAVNAPSTAITRPCASAMVQGARCHQGGMGGRMATGNRKQHDPFGADNGALFRRASAAHIAASNRRTTRDL